MNEDFIKYLNQKLYQGQKDHNEFKNKLQSDPGFVEFIFNKGDFASKGKTIDDFRKELNITSSSKANTTTSTSTPNLVSTQKPLLTPSQLRINLEQENEEFARKPENLLKSNTWGARGGRARINKDVSYQKLVTDKFANGELNVLDYSAEDLNEIYGNKDHNAKLRQQAKEAKKDLDIQRNDRDPIKDAFAKWTGGAFGTLDTNNEGKINITRGMLSPVNQPDIYLTEEEILGMQYHPLSVKVDRSGKKVVDKNPNSFHNKHLRNIQENLVSSEKMNFAAASTGIFKKIELTGSNLKNTEKKLEGVLGKGGLGKLNALSQKIQEEQATKQEQQEFENLLQKYQNSGLAERYEELAENYNGLNEEIKGLKEDPKYGKYKQLEFLKESAHIQNNTRRKQMSKTGRVAEDISSILTNLPDKAASIPKDVIQGVGVLTEAITGADLGATDAVFKEAYRNAEDIFSSKQTRGVRDKSLWLHGFEYVFDSKTGKAKEIYDKDGYVLTVDDITRGELLNAANEAYANGAKLKQNTNYEPLLHGVTQTAPDLLLMLSAGGIMKAGLKSLGKAATKVERVNRVSKWISNAGTNIAESSRLAEAGSLIPVFVGQTMEDAVKSGKISTPRELAAVTGSKLALETISDAMFAGPVGKLLTGKGWTQKALSEGIETSLRETIQHYATGKITNADFLRAARKATGEFLGTNGILGEGIEEALVSAVEPLVNDVLNQALDVSFDNTEVDFDEVESSFLVGAVAGSTMSGPQMFGELWNYKGNTKEYYKNKLNDIVANTTEARMKNDTIKYPEAFKSAMESLVAKKHITPEESIKYTEAINRASKETEYLKTPKTSGLDAVLGLADTESPEYAFNSYVRNLAFDVARAELAATTETNEYGKQVQTQVVQERKQALKELEKNHYHGVFSSKTPSIIALEKAGRAFTDQEFTELKQAHETVLKEVGASKFNNRNKTIAFEHKMQKAINNILVKSPVTTEPEKVKLAEEAKKIEENTPIINAEINKSELKAGNSAEILNPKQQEELSAIEKADVDSFFNEIPLISTATGVSLPMDDINELIKENPTQEEYILQKVAELKGKAIQKNVANQNTASTTTKGTAEIGVKERYKQSPQLKADEEQLSKSQYKASLTAQLQDGLDNNMLPPDEIAELTNKINSIDNTSMEDLYKDPEYKAILDNITKVSAPAAKATPEQAVEAKKKRGRPKKIAETPKPLIEESEFPTPPDPTEESTFILSQANLDIPPITLDDVRVNIEDEAPYIEPETNQGTPDEVLDTPIDERITDIERRRQEDLEKKVQILKDKRNALRGEDGVVPKENIAEWQQLGKDVIEAQNKATRGNNEGFIPIRTEKDGVLSGEDAINAENEIERVIQKIIKGEITIEQAVSFIHNKYKVLANENEFLLNYINDRTSNAPEIGNNKQSFPAWRKGKYDAELEAVQPVVEPVKVTPVEEAKVEEAKDKPKHELELDVPLNATIDDILNLIAGDTKGELKEVVSGTPFMRNDLDDYIKIIEHAKEGDPIYFEVGQTRTLKVVEMVLYFDPATNTFVKKGKGTQRMVVGNLNSLLNKHTQAHIIAKIIESGGSDLISTINDAVLARHNKEHYKTDNPSDVVETRHITMEELKILSPYMYVLGKPFDSDLASDIGTMEGDDITVLEKTIEELQTRWQERNYPKIDPITGKERTTPPPPMPNKGKMINILQGKDDQGNKINKTEGKVVILIDNQILFLDTLKIGDVQNSLKELEKALDKLENDNKGAKLTYHFQHDEVLKKRSGVQSDKANLEKANVRGRLLEVYKSKKDNEKPFYKLDSANNEIYFTRQEILDELKNIRVHIDHNSLQNPTDEYLEKLSNVLTVTVRSTFPLIYPSVQAVVPFKKDKDLKTTTQKTSVTPVEAVAQVNDTPPPPKEDKPKRKIKEEDISYSIEPITSAPEVDPNLQKTYFNDGFSTTVSETLDKIANSTSPLNVLARRLQKYAAINNITLYLDDVAYYESETNPNLKGAGYYDSAKNEIRIAKNSKHRQGRGERLLLHEILHALSYHELRKKGQYTNDFYKLYEAAIAKLGTYDSKTKEGEYGTYTIDEFFVAIFTDSKFIKELQQIPPTKGINYLNLFDEIVNYLLGLLGIKKKDSLYTQAVSVASYILEDQLINGPEAFDEAYYEGLEAMAFNNTENVRPQDKLFKFLNNYGFEVTDAQNLLINLANKTIALDTSNIEQISKALAEPLAEMLSYSDYFYQIEKEVRNTAKYKNRLLELQKENKDSTKRNIKRLATKKIFKELLEKGFSEKLTKELNISKPLLKQIKDFINNLINSLKDINLDIINNNINAIVENTFKDSDFIRLTIKEGYKQVDFQQAFDENDIAKDIMTTLGTNPNIVLTGSIAYATQGTVYRKIETVVHDLDFVNNGLSTEEINRLVLDNYPDSLKAYSFFDKYNVDTYLIPPRGFTIQNVKRRETGKIISYELVDSSNKIVGTYKLGFGVSSTNSTIDEVEIKTGIEAMLVDFFSNDESNRNVVKYPFIGNDGKTHTVNLSEFSSPFEAKLRYSRFKDIWDYNRFIPNNLKEYTPPTSSNFAFSISDWNDATSYKHAKFLSNNIFNVYLMDKYGLNNINQILAEFKDVTIDKLISDFKNQSENLKNSWFRYVTDRNNLDEEDIMDFTATLNDVFEQYKNDETFTTIVDRQISAYVGGKATFDELGEDELASENSLENSDEVVGDESDTEDIQTGISEHTKNQAHTDSRTRASKRLREFFGKLHVATFKKDNGKASRSNVRDPYLYFPEYYEGELIHNKLLNELSDSVSYQDMINKINELPKKYIWGVDVIAEVLKLNAEQTIEAIDNNTLVIPSDILNNPDSYKANTWLLKDLYYAIADQTNQNKIKLVNAPGNQEGRFSNAVTNNDLENTIEAIKDRLKSLSTTERESLLARVTELKDNLAVGKRSTLALKKFFEQIGYSVSTPFLIHLGDNSSTFVEKGKTISNNDAFLSILLGFSIALKNNNLRQADNEIKKLAKLLNTYENSSSNLSFLNIKNELEFAHVPQGFLKRQFTALKNNINEWIQSKTSLVNNNDVLFHRWLSFYEDIKNFSYDIFEDGFVTTEGQSFGGKEYKDYSGIDLIINSLNAFAASITGEGGSGINVKGHGLFHFGVFSDSPKRVILRAPVFKKAEVIDKMVSTVYGELERIRLHAKGSLVKFKNLSENGGIFHTIPELNDVQVKYAGQESYVPLTNYLSGWENNSKNSIAPQISEIIVDGIPQDIDNFNGKSYHTAMNNVVGEIMNNYHTRYIDDLISKGLLETKDGEYVRPQNSKLYKEIFSGSTLQDFYYNKFYNNVITQIVFAGDPASYKKNKFNSNTDVDIVKRFKQLISPTIRKAVADKTNPITGERSTNLDVLTIKEIEVDDSTFGGQSSLSDAGAYHTIARRKELIKADPSMDQSLLGVLDRLDNGTYKQEDLDKIFQPIKPFLFTNILERTPTGEIISIPIQLKNSEVLLLPSIAYEVENQGTFVRPKSIKDIHENNYVRPELAKILFLMETNNIDIAVYDSASKAEAFGIVDIDEITDDNADLKDVNNYRLTTLQLSDWGEQMAVPEHHFDSKIRDGIQVGKIMTANVDPNFSFTLDGKEYKGLEGVNELISLIQVNDINFNLEKTLNKISDKDGTISNDKIIKLISDKLIDEQPSVDTIQGLKIQSDGRPLVPLELLGQKIQQSLNAMFKKIPVFKSKGASFVNQPSVGFIDRAKDIYQRGAFRDDLKMVTDVDNNNNTVIKHWEAMVPVYDPIIYQYIDSKGNLLLDDKKEPLIPEEYLHAFLYRIPTEDKYSTYHIKIVKFLPQAQGGTIILPKEATEMTGLDFDVDKLYGFFYNHDVRYTPKFKDYAINNFSKGTGIEKATVKKYMEFIEKYNTTDITPEQLTEFEFNSQDAENIEVFHGNFNRYLDKLDKLIDTKYEKGFQIRDIESSLTSDKGRQNLKLDIYIKLSQTHGFFKSATNPGNKKRLIKLRNELASKPSSRSFADPLQESENAIKNIVGKKLVGIFANANAFYNMIQGVVTLQLKKKLFITIGEAKYEFNSIGAPLEDISRDIAELLFASTEDVKDPVLAPLNINETTSNLLIFLLSATNTSGGKANKMSFENAIKFINQPQVLLDVERATQGNKRLTEIGSPFNHIYKLSEAYGNIIINSKIDAEIGPNFYSVTNKLQKIDSVFKSISSSGQYMGITNAQDVLPDGAGSSKIAKLNTLRTALETEIAAFKQLFSFLSPSITNIVKEIGLYTKNGVLSEKLQHKVSYYIYDAAIANRLDRDVMLNELDITNDFNNLSNFEGESIKLRNALQLVDGKLQMRPLAVVGKEALRDLKYALSALFETNPEFAEKLATNMLMSGTGFSITSATKLIPNAYWTTPTGAKMRRLLTMEVSSNIDTHITAQHIILNHFNQMFRKVDDTELAELLKEEFDRSLEEDEGQKESYVWNQNDAGKQTLYQRGQYGWEQVTEKAKASKPNYILNSIPVPATPEIIPDIEFNGEPDSSVDISTLKIITIEPATTQEYQDFRNSELEKNPYLTEEEIEEHYKKCRPDESL